MFWPLAEPIGLDAGQGRMVCTDLHLEFAAYLAAASSSSFLVQLMLDVRSGRLPIAFLRGEVTPAWALIGP